MTRFLNVEQVIALHDTEVVCPVTDRGKLEGAVLQPQATWDGVYLYPTLLQQAAVLLYGVANAHGFLDGNKRTGWLSCVVFLDMNGVELVDVAQGDVEEMVVAAVEGDVTAEDVVLWLIDRV